MRDILQASLSIPGIRGGLLFDNDRRILCHNLGEGQAETELVLAVRAMWSAIDFLRSRHPHWDSLVAQFASGVLIVRNLDQRAVLALLADPRAQLQVVRISASIAAQRLLEGLNRQDRADRADREDRDDRADRDRPFSGPSAASGKMALRHPDAGATPTMLIDRCVRALAYHIGPVAKLIVRRALAQIAPEGRWSDDKLPDLVSMLAAELDGPEARARFSSLLLGGGGALDGHGHGHGHGAGGVDAAGQGRRS